MGRIFGHIPTHYTLIYVVLAKVVLFESQKDESWNLTPSNSQKRKMWVFQLAVKGKL